MADEPGVILVTGASGFIGAHVVNELLKKGIKTKAMLRDLSLKSIFEENENLEIVYGDLFDIVLEDFENGTSWYVESDASAGFWELGIPNGSVAQGLGFLENDFIVQTDADHSENGEYCFVTGNAEIEIISPGQDDVDGGSTILYSDQLL